MWWISALLFLGCFLPTHAWATFIAHWVADDYIVVGADSRSIGNGASDRNCKIHVLDDNHVFTVTGINGGTDLISPSALANQILESNRKASTGDLTSQFLKLEKFDLVTYFKKHPEEMRPPIQFNGKPVDIVVKPFFGMTASMGSSWSAGEISMDESRTTWKELTELNRKPVDAFISLSPDGELSNRFSAGRPQPSNDANSMATEMLGLIKFVIQHASKPGQGGEPEVVALEYGKPPRWYAGADICGAKTGAEPVTPKKLEFRPPTADEQR
jgi:hypothetical protein